MLVAHLTSVHPPNDTRILLKECRSLADAGHEVHLIAREMPGFDAGPHVHHIPLAEPRNRKERILGTVVGLYRKAIALNADVYHFHDPELLPVGLLLKLKGKRVVYDVHEDYSKSILDRGWIPALLRRPVASITDVVEKFVASRLDAVVAATPAIERRFRNHRTECVQNFPIVGELLEADPVPYSERPLWVTYVGIITKLRGVEVTWKALSEEGFPEGMRLRLAGKFYPESLVDELKATPAGARTDILGHQNRAQVGELLSHSRVGLVLFQPAPNHMEAQPNKLFEYLSAGVPVVASHFPMWREIIEANQVGLVVDPTDPIAVADAVRWLLEHPVEAEAMGQRGKKLVEEKLNWDIESEKLVALYEALSAGARPRKTKGSA